MNYMDYPYINHNYANYSCLQAFMDAVDGMRVSLGPMKVLSYVVQVGEIRQALLSF